MSTSCFDREDGVFKVLVNHEEQYSLWPEWKAIPGGWSETGVQGDKKSCLEYVEKTWTDMRPLSLLITQITAALEAEDDASAAGYFSPGVELAPMMRCSSKDALSVACLGASEIVDNTASGAAHAQWSVFSS